MAEMFENIGKIRLNKQWYRGEDAYSDGDATENQLLKIVQEHTPDEYNDIIMREGSWPLLYHLSPARENLIYWYPFKSGAKVLELGSGCGAVTGALLNRDLEVYAVDLSLRRCRINAYRHADCDGLEICVGAIEDVLKHIDIKFDYVLLIGALEYAAMFSDAPEPQKYMLECIDGVMSPDGELLVAIENQLGLKYWAGCREDHTGRFFEGLENYPHRDGPVTFSRRRLTELFSSCGFESEYFYPYPDYKFPIKVFSDRKLPAKGELNRNWHCFDANRMRLFDENRVDDALIEAGLIGDFANSFLVRLTKREQDQEERVVYVKSSVERKPEYRHHTLILETKEGKVVRKKAASDMAVPHLQNMLHCHDALVRALRPDASVVIAPCRVNDDGTVDFPYYAEDTLRDLLSRMGGNADAFCEAVLRFRDALKSAFGTEVFKADDMFRRFFGAPELPDGMDALTVTNLDMNFDNIFIGEHDVHTIVDYEWVMPFSVPLSFIIFRALLVNLDMAAFDSQTRERIWDRLGIGKELRETYLQMELRFQAYVSGVNNKLEDFRNRSLEGLEATMTTAAMLNAVSETRRLNDDVQTYKDALDKQIEASRELTRQRDEYRTALDAQNEASAELTRQRDEYRAALDAQNEASAELTRQRDEYRTALDAQNEASAELTRQRDEYHAANDALWERVSVAEAALQAAQAELEKHKPFWRRH